MRFGFWACPVSVLVGAAISTGAAIAQPARPASSPQAELETLVKAAKAEGEVFFYSGVTENVAKRTGDAFTAKFGVKASFTRTAGVQTVRRFSTEAEAGTFVADFLVSGGAIEQFAIDAAQKGWVEAVGKAGIPAVAGSEFPARFLADYTAIIQISPWGIGYNTQKIAASEAPRSWPDLLQPRFKGQILVPDPRSAHAYSEFWDVMMEMHGEAFLTGLRNQNMRNYASGVPATNGLAAGEGMLAIPQSGGQMQGVIAKGAPIALVVPEQTTGFEIKLALTHRAKAKHPNAGRLFTHFVMSAEGNRIFNADPGSNSVYDLSGLPKRYQSPKRDAGDRLNKVAPLLGY